jgi:serine/threonine protein kinase
MNKDMLAKKKGGASEESYFEDIKREIAIMKKLRHPNVLQLFEVLDDPKVTRLTNHVCILSNNVTYILKGEQNVPCG